MGYHHGDLKNALIEAGADILSKEGIGSLSLRKVAQRAGVSHAAPYAHFTDKQALIAAISTEGYRRLQQVVKAAVDRHEGEPGAQLVAASWAYVKFALESPDYFKVTLSGVVEMEKQYPAFVEISHQSFDMVVALVEACQRGGVLSQGPSDVAAVSVWSLIHGLASLVIEDQVPSAVLDRVSVADLLHASLSRIAQVELPPIPG
jgi:AcrR family transcriptional regulator